MVYNIAEIKYTSFYPVLMQKRHTYVHRAIFYLNKQKKNNMKLYQKKVQHALVSCQGRERCIASRRIGPGDRTAGDTRDRRGRGDGGGDLTASWLYTFQ
jgi:hypothetical protein